MANVNWWLGKGTIKQLPEKLSLAKHLEWKRFDFPETEV